MRAPANRTRRLAVATALVLASTFVVAALPSSAGAASAAPIAPAVAAAMKRDGKAVFWVVLKAKPDLRTASGMSWNARGRFVADKLRSTAEQSQAGLQALLRARGAAFTPYWGANVIKVTGNAATLDAVAHRPDVKDIEPDTIYRISRPTPSIHQAVVQSVEWNIANIRADQVWSTFGDRGEGIVVATIDTGVQFDHPAVVNQYRGNLGGGNFDHNYNWDDPSNVCGNPSLAPCDNSNHGTHTMGTIVGDDGAGNQIGVAPGARWIAAKGCETGSCSTAALVAAGQWMLAPTDLAGHNPRSDLRPNIVSNSWGDGPGNTFYQAIVQNWVAAGIFPVFANGNSGPSCGTVGSPGDYPESYGVGAYDINNNIASFSSRGPSSFGVAKPNISAPGVNVRSSIPTNSYASFNGTSMATPHVAGAVALVWSAAPSLVGDISQTRQLLDQTAIDSADTTCGGTNANNDVFGEGRLDAFAAVNAAPRGPTGILQGTVTDSVTHAALAGIQVHAVGPSDRTTSTNASGNYSLTLSVGTYNVTASGFGYVSQTAASQAITNGGTLTRDFALAASPRHSLSGHVRDGNGNPLANAKVTIAGTPIAPATTDAGGAYSFASVPEGTYNVTAQAGRCAAFQTQSVSLTVDRTVDFALGPRKDAFGYSCTELAAAWVSGTDVLPLTGDDAWTSAALPFNFPFYGNSYGTANITTNGYASFTGGSAVWANTTIPDASTPNAAVYPFWDDLWVDASSSVRTATLGVAPNRQFVIEWVNVGFFATLANRIDAEVVLSENGEILTQYRNIAPGNGMEQGNSATVGIENAAGNDAFQYSANEASLSDGFAVRWSITAFNGATGTVTDANDSLPIQGATVRALQNGNPVASTTTGANGGYQLQLAPGSYTIEASNTNYETASSALSLAQGQTATQNFALHTGRLSVSPASLTFILGPGQQQTQSLTVSNLGTGSLAWSVSEDGGNVAWLSETPTGGTLAPSASATVQVTADASLVGSPSGSATLDFQSNAAKQATAQIPVSVSVSPFQRRVNAGGPTLTVAGNVWSADQAFSTGAWGYTNASSTTLSSTKAIANTVDDVLYRSLRVNPTEYRFTVPNGTYRVELRFAELKRLKQGARVFNVTIEGTTVLTNFDIVGKVGLYTADVEVFTAVTVSDGVLNIGFANTAGAQLPVVNAIWVAQQ